MGDRKNLADLPQKNILTRQNYIKIYKETFVGTHFWEKVCLSPNCLVKWESQLDELYGLRQIGVHEW